VPKDKLGLRRSTRGRQISFAYDPNLRFNGEYFWLPVQCEELLDLREQLGLRREPRMPLHLTVARVS
jgi:hypothetical protein